METLPAVIAFQYKLQDVRVVEIDGEPWLVEADIKKILGLSGHNKYNLLDGEKGTYKIGTPGGPQDMNIVNESGMYKLIMRSNKTDAAPFQTWVTSEVLPSIRKTRQYQMSGHPTPREPLPDAGLQARELAIRMIAVEINLHELFGIPRIHALQEGVKQVRRELSIDMSEYLRLSSHADALPATNEFLEIAELSLRYNLRRGVLNKWLKRYGYQALLDDGAYEPTEHAQREGLCFRHAWAKGTKSGQNVKWRVTFIDENIERVRQYQASMY